MLVGEADQHYPKYYFARRRRGVMSVQNLSQASWESQVSDFKNTLMGRSQSIA